MEVTREIVLPLDRDAAWAAVADLDRWLAEESALELRPGGEGELTLPGGATRFATVEDVEPGERLSFWWHAPDALATRVELTLADAAQGTRVVVVESGYAGAPVCGTPWAGGADCGPRARSGAAGTASPGLPLGRAWVLSALDWDPAIERLRRAGDLVAA
jgi:hypothetical protein